MSANEQIRSCRDLDVWKVAMDVVVETYQATRRFPNSEQYGLSGQMRRSALSVPSNVAEGHARRGRAYRNHVRTALGSAAELDTQIEAAVRLGFLTAADAANLVQMNTRVTQMLFRLSASLRRNRWVVGASLTLVAFTSWAALFRLFG